MADLLLYDINVELGIAYADPTREQFPFFQPFYRRHPDSPLRERLLCSYENLNDGPRLLVREAVVESLRRCAMQWLGLWRALEIFDLHQAVAPEALSSATAARLLSLRNAADPNDRAVWLDHLIRRLREGNISPDVDHTIWLDVIRDIQNDGLITAARYIAAAPLRGNVGILKCLDAARKRLQVLDVSDRLRGLELLDDIQREAIPGEASWLKAANGSMVWLDDQTELCVVMTRGLKATGWNLDNGLGSAEQAEVDFVRAQ